MIDMTNKPWQDKLIDIEPYVAGEQPQRADIIKQRKRESLSAVTQRGGGNKGI